MRHDSPEVAADLRVFSYAGFMRPDSPEVAAPEVAGVMRIEAAPEVADPEAVVTEEALINEVESLNVLLEATYGAHEDTINDFHKLAMRPINKYGSNLNHFVGYNEDNFDVAQVITYADATQAIKDNSSSEDNSDDGYIFECEVNHTAI